MSSVTHRVIACVHVERDSTPQSKGVNVGKPGEMRGDAGKTSLCYLFSDFLSSIPMNASGGQFKTRLKLAVAVGVVRVSLR